MLAVSGVLDETMFGPGTLDQGMRRRSIYFTVKRSQLIPLMTLFDVPDSLQGLGSRGATTVAPEALAMMNNGRRCSNTPERWRGGCSATQPRVKSTRSAAATAWPWAGLRWPRKSPTHTSS